MPSSVHKISMHGAEIIDTAILQLDNYRRRLKTPAIKTLRNLESLILENVSA